MKRRLIAIAAFMLFGAAVSRAQVPIDFEGVDSSKIDLNVLQLLFSTHDRLTIPYPRPVLTIRWDSKPGVFHGGCGQIWITFYPTKPTDINNSFYRAILHEYNHAKWCDASGSTFPMEPIALAGVNLTYRELARTFPGITGSTDVFWDKVMDNMPAYATGGGKGYYDNKFLFYMSSKFELLASKLPGKNLNGYYQMLKNVRPQTLQQHLAMLDMLTDENGQPVRIDGLNPSTYFQESSAMFLNGPDGTFFALDLQGRAKIAGLSGVAPVNPVGVNPLFTSRQNGATILSSKPSSFQWKVFDGAGNDVTVNAMFPHADAGCNATALNMKLLKNGTYKFVGFCDPAMSDTEYFVVYSGAWEKGKLFVFANGPEFGDLNASTMLHLVGPPQGVTTETYPGLLVVNLNGSTQDIVVSDGRKTRTFSVDWEVSRFVFFTDRDQSYLYSATNGASFVQGPLVPGSIFTLFTWGATHNDPQLAGILPLPKSCGGAKAVFSSDSMTAEAPVFYCSQAQLNVQVPKELAGLQSVRIKLMLGSTASNTIEVPLAETSPGIFVVDWKSRTGAVIFENGQIVDSGQPASRDDMLSLYATGLGATDPPLPPDGEANPTSPLSYTVAAPILTLDGVPCTLWFSGLAPTFVGLYQINFTIPDGLPPGTHKLVLSMANSTSNTVILVTR